MNTVPPRAVSSVIWPSTQTVPSFPIHWATICSTDLTGRGASGEVFALTRSVFQLGQPVLEHPDHLRARRARLLVVDPALDLLLRPAAHARPQRGEGQVGVAGDGLGGQVAGRGLLGVTRADLGHG